mgnify:CR=1 FL=1
MNRLNKLFITLILIILSGILDAYLLLKIGDINTNIESKKEIIKIASIFISSNIVKLLSISFSQSIASTYSAIKIKDLWNNLTFNKSYTKTVHKEEVIKSALITCGDKLMFQYYLPFFTLLGGGCTLIFNIGAIFYKYKINAIIFISFIFIFLLIFKLFTKPIIKKNAKMQLDAVESLDREITNMYKSTILRESNLSFQWIENNFQIALNKLSSYRWRNGFISVLPKGGLEIIGGLLLIFLIVVVNNDFPLTSLLFLGIAGLKIVPAFQAVSSNLTAISDGRVSKSYIEKIFIQEVENINILNNKNLESHNTQVINKIEFHSYPNAKSTPKVIEKGKISFLDDVSGSGKSTFCRHISGISSSFKSSVFKNLKVLVNDQEIKLSKIKKFIFYCEQFPPILDGSLKSNLGIKNLNTLDPITISNLKEILPHNIFRLIDRDESIMNILSGGEIARIGIARALISKREILIFDEPFSSLDKDNAQKILSIFENLAQNKLILIISHQKLKTKLPYNLFKISE